MEIEEFSYQTNFAWNLFAKFQEILTSTSLEALDFGKILSVINCTNSEFGASKTVKLVVLQHSQY